jgi:hypothetical protein
MVRIRARKTRHFFRIYFRGDSHFGNSVVGTARRVTMPETRLEDLYRGEILISPND